jgi:long-chain acyl-CoA synthetase
VAVVLTDAARSKPNEVAIRDSSKTLTWSELNATINRLVNNMKPRDLGPNRRIAVYAENSVETALAHMGALHAGLSSVPVNFHLNAEEAAYILNDSGTRLLFTGPENLERAVDAVAQLPVPIPVVVWRAEGSLPAGARRVE